MVSSVVSISGGMDSLFTVASLRKKHPDRKVLGLFLDYGQLSAREERRHAWKIAREFGVCLEEATVSLPFWKDLPLLNPGIDVVFKTRKGSSRALMADNEEACFAYGVPARNAVVASLLHAMASTAGAQDIWLGLREDTGIADQSPAFVKALSGLLRAAGDDIKVVCPGMGLSKAGVAKALLKWGVDLKLSWSCYRGGYAHCGKCPGCAERAEGISLVDGVDDPTDYEDGM